MNNQELQKELNKLKKENKRLKSAVDELTVLYDIAATVSASHSVNKMLDSIVRKCILHFNVEQGAILLLANGENEGKFQTVIRKGEEQIDKLPYRLDTQLTGWIMKYRQPLMINDFKNDDRFAVDNKNTSAIRSLLCVPLIVKNELIGLVVLFNKRNLDEFTDEDLRTLSIISGESAQIIENARLYEKESKLQREKEEAELANKLKSECIASMSHEIRTPLHSILGYSDLLKKRVSDPKSKDFLSAVISSGKSLMMIINDILDLSKIEAGKLEIQYEPLKLNDLFNEIEQIFSIKFYEKGLKFTATVYENEDKYILVDETRLRQALVNLVGNAVKFTDEGSIEVSAKCRTDATDNSMINLTIDVADTGMGIEDERKDLIFHAFHQKDNPADNSLGGAGLGLTITKRLIELMGGTISVKSYPGKGSTFTIKINNVEIAHNDIRTKDTIDDYTDFIEFGGGKILIVDDNPMNINLIREYLFNMNLDIHHAENGEEALNLIKVNNPDIVLMDLRMPVMDGYKATKILKASEKTKNLPVIAVTASALKSDLQKITDAGFDGYLRKPLSRSELIKELSKYLENTYNDELLSTPKEPQQVIEEPTGKSAFSDEIKSIFINKFEQRAKMLSMVPILSDVKKFSKDIIVFSKEHNVPVLREYGEKLYQYCDSLDHDKMTDSLNRFNELFEKE